MPGEVAIRICYMGLVLQWGTSPYQLLSIYCSEIDRIITPLLMYCMYINSGALSYQTVINNIKITCYVRYGAYKVSSESPRAKAASIKGSL